MSTSPDAIVIVKPLTITDAMLTDTDVTEADYSAWSAATTYALSARVILTSVHKIYESLQAGNLNHNPLTSPTWWIEVGPTNRWKCFDTSNSTQTLTNGGATPSITYELTPGKSVTAIGVLNVSRAYSISVTMTDPVYGEVYSSSADMSEVPAASEWWEWFFGDRAAPTQYIATDLPSYPDAAIVVTLTGTVELAVGVILIGQQRRFAVGIDYGTSIGMMSYSRKETNDFGDTVLVRRANAKKLGLSMLLTRAEIDQINMFLASVDAVPCLYIISTLLESMSLFGFYRTFEILINYEDYADCSLNLEGLT